MGRQVWPIPSKCKLSPRPGQVPPGSPGWFPDCLGRLQGSGVPALLSPLLPHSPHPQTLD